MKNKNPRILKQNNNIKSEFVYKTSLSDVLQMKRDEFIRKICLHKVLVISTKTISIPVYKALIEKLGKFINHPLDNYCLLNNREILKISNFYDNSKAIGVHNGGTYWHTDMSYLKDKNIFTSLYCDKIPLNAKLNATEFIDCEGGYTNVLNAIKSGLISNISILELNTRKVKHVFGNREKKTNSNAEIQEMTNKQQDKLENFVWHPFVIKHPITNKYSIYAPAATSYEIEGFNKELSLKILNQILSIILNQAPKYKHIYKPGEIVIWDNISTIHRGLKIKASNNEKDMRLLFRMNIKYN